MGPSGPTVPHLRPKVGSVGQRPWKTEVEMWSDGEFYAVCVSVVSVYDLSPDTHLP